jgi:hypothetical protein
VDRAPKAKTRLNGDELPIWRLVTRLSGPPHILDRNDVAEVLATIEIKVERHHAIVAPNALKDFLLRIKLLQHLGTTRIRDVIS